VCTVGLELANTLFPRVGIAPRGKRVWHKRLTRHALLALMAPRPLVPMGWAACGGAPDWARPFGCPGAHVQCCTGVRPTRHR
jgi:hypothetical protein